MKIWHRLNLFKYAFFILLISIGLGCENEEKLFTLLSQNQTNIKFKNILQETKDFNVLQYGYLYNGGGVSVGDVNNDGLEDLYFTGNMVASRLYINQGDFKFKEVAELAGVDAPGLWNTGTTMVDINSDGFLDIFVCRSAAENPNYRRNLLFINNGDLTFTESAALYGITDTGYTTQALFFDYDKDNDLDLYVLNHSVQEYAGFDRLTGKLKEKVNPNYGDKLYENVEGIFLDRTNRAGIKNNVLGFGLGIAMGDFNHDQWPDLYISNDYNEQDYLYINNQDGTFSEQLENFMTHTSMFSMGSDAADINNDGFLDLFTLDMLPEGDERQKMVLGPDNYEKFQQLNQSGFYYQSMRNMLQLNQGGKFFTEIGQLAGVSNTDWSWAPLFADFDNDGFKDLFITNGYKKDYTNMDFVSYAVQQRMDEMNNRQEIALLDLIDKIPSTVEENYMYKNLGGLTFDKMNTTWGFDQKTLSNGAAYSDLDNDGDLDLIVNNIDSPAFVYRNNAEREPSNYIQVILQDTLSRNREGIGASVQVFADTLHVLQIMQPTRGFQSSVGRRLHFGLGMNRVVDSIHILWPDGTFQKETQIKSNEINTLYKKKSKIEVKLNHEAPVFKEVNNTDWDKITHIENEFVDFKRERLMLHFESTQGPRISVADVNQDGKDDFYLVGATNSPGSLWIQNSKGSFVKSEQEDFLLQMKTEEVASLFFDADSDGDLDLYVVSGGNENQGELLRDALYINEKGKFKRKNEQLPLISKSGSCVVANDIDSDGDLDLFIGTRLVPGKFPESDESQLLLNDGKGNFSLNQNLLPDQNQLGNITDAVWADVDGDNQNDLIVVGEWMSPRIFYHTPNGFKESVNEKLKSKKGFWNRIVKADFNSDGLPDFAITNYGLNSQLKTPLTLFYDDFDNNGSIDPILCITQNNEYYPYWSKDDLLSQLNSLKSKYVSYASYASDPLKNILNENQLREAQKIEVNTFASSILLNMGNDEFEWSSLPISIQMAPLYGITVFDADQDGKQDLIVGGNLFGTRARFGRFDASKGEFLKGKGDGTFEVVSYAKSGLKIEGEVRDIVPIQLNQKPHFLIGRNNNSIKIFAIRD